MLFTFLIRLFVQRFYVRNTPFFLFFFLLFFATVKAASLVAFHHFLMQSILDSYWFLAGVLFLWFLYNRKCVVFIQKKLRDPGYLFVYQLQAKAGYVQALLFAGIHLLLFLPVLSYITYMVIWAFKKGLWLQPMLLMAFCIGLTVGSVWLYLTRLNVTYSPRERSGVTSQQRPAETPFLLFLLYYAFTQKRADLLAIKVFAIALLYIALVMNGHWFKHDVLVLFLMVISLAHVRLPLQFVRFVERDLGFHRNLPVSRWRMGGMYFLTSCCLFLPELAYFLLTGKGQFSLFQLIGIYLALVHLFFFAVAILYSGSHDAADLIKVFFMIHFIAIFFINGGHFLPFNIILASLSAVLFLTGYYHYDMPDKKPLLEGRVKKGYE